MTWPDIGYISSTTSLNYMRHYRLYLDLVSSTDISGEKRDRLAFGVHDSHGEGET